VATSDETSGKKTFAFSVKSNIISGKEKSVITPQSTEVKMELYQWLR